MWVEVVTSKSGVTKYKFLERYVDPYSGKTKRASITYSSNSRQAYKAASAELQNKIAELTNTDVNKDMLFNDVISNYLDSKRSFQKPSTIYALDRLHKIIMRCFPKDILLSKLSTYIIQTTLDTISAKYAYNTTRAIVSLIKQSLKYARRMGHIYDISFLDNIEIQKPPTDVDRIKKQRSKFLTKSELQQLLQLIDKTHHHVALLCEFQSLTGLRFGEMVALRTQDYDKTTNEIDINGTLSTYGSAKNPAKRLPPKNIHSIRKVQLDPRAAQIINYFLTANQARKLWKGQFTNTDYIFVTDGGLPYDLNFVNKILRKINFHKHISTHTFRHTHISFLAEANVPLKAIMERVGHNEPRTTLAVYAHVTDEMRKEMNNAINSIGKSISHK